MELSGEEKKLQALFSELKQAEEQGAPRFARVWNRAQPGVGRVRAASTAFVPAMVLLVCAVFGLAVWSRYRQPTPTPPVVRVETATGTNTRTSVLSAPAEPPAPAKATQAGERIVSKLNRSMTRRNATQLAANRKLTQEAKAITDWESPTSALLSSSTDSLFSSLPQLNENASGLQSYLPSRPN